MACWSMPSEVVSSASRGPPAKVTLTSYSPPGHSTPTGMPFCDMRITVDLRQQHCVQSPPRTPVCGSGRPRGHPNYTPVSARAPVPAVSLQAAGVRHTAGAGMSAGKELGERSAACSVFTVSAASSNSNAVQRWGAA